MKLMSIKEKFFDCILTMVIWSVVAFLLDYFFGDGKFEKHDFTYWGGAFVGYCIAISTKKILKK